MSVRLLLALAACSLFLSSASAVPPSLPPASAEKLPRWRGFNLLEKFNKGNCQPFREDDFQLISKLGFNFVRLPMDYRCWIVDGNWEKLNENQLREIDQAVEFGKRYGIHTCLNFHRAPGYTVAKPAEEKSVWTDPDALRVCALHWSAFARRYKGIPNEQLSFNLFNEPAHIPLEQFVPVIQKLVEAIRAEDPSRLIISDGLQWGTIPVPELAPLHVAQATRGYQPGVLTHYKASWVHGENFPMPQWPRPIYPPGHFYGPAKKEPKDPLVIEGPFAKASTLRLHIGRVSQSGKLVASAGETKLWEKDFANGPGEGEWKQAEFKSEYNIYQNIWDRDYTVPVPAGTPIVTISMPSGDWLEVTELGISSSDNGSEDVLKFSQSWGKPLPHLTYKPGSREPFGGIEFEDGQKLWTEAVEPWQKLAAMNVGVVVGEWGSYNKTPHDVVLRWAEDCLKNWQRAGFGWALWNFRGGFGVLDSERADVTYEDFEGHKLDRKLLDLLLKY